MSEYKYVGLNIPKKIKIVSKKLRYFDPKLHTWVDSETYKQGYVVDASNATTLESAKNWAGKDYEIFEYDNGTFKISLHDSAGGSSQGGRLSFWNCWIKAKDNNKFLVGINSDILIDLLKCNDFIKGECQSNVYLGKYKGNNTGVFTENMPQFTQAQKDEELRQENKKATSSY